MSNKLEKRIEELESKVRSLTTKYRTVTKKLSGAVHLEEYSFRDGAWELKFKYYPDEFDSDSRVLHEIKHHNGEYGYWYSLSVEKTELEE